jgi:hypothetical protein
MQHSSRTFGLFTALFVCAAPGAGAEGLLGSPASMVHQHAVAVKEEYTFLRTPLEVRQLVAEGKLVPVTESEDVTLAGVSFPVTRPEVRAFIVRFARDYHDSTGVKLTVTSLTRPEALQPRNAHVLSVHPAGMAVDFRVPSTPAERAYLERALLSMEKGELLDVTRERTPAHYHVAVFAGPTLAWVAARDAADPPRDARLAASPWTASARALAAVPHRLAIDSIDASRLPLFFFAMAALLGMAVALVHTPTSPGARVNARS